MKFLQARMHVLIVLFCLSSALISCSGERPTDIGITNGKFKACPDKPNCINSFSGDDGHAMEPLSFKGNIVATKAKIKAIVEGMPRTNLASETQNYMHYEFTTPTMKFVDDVEFYFDAANQQIHFRSASRLGHSDLGLNKKRMTSISEAYNK